MQIKTEVVNGVVGMNSEEARREQVSAFIDGELSDQQLEIVLATLRQPEGKNDWDLYHRIGDVLRSDDMDVQFSPDFSARMAARLSAEPPLVAPQAVRGTAEGTRIKRWAVPGLTAAAAVASVAFFASPQLMVAFRDTEAVPVAAVNGEKLVATPVPEGVVLRDPRMDDYLLAHQRFSPSVYSTAQYARSAAFASK